MKKYDVNNEEDLRKASEEIFPGESYTKAIEFIDQIRKLVPADKEKINYLNTLFTYVDGIINGDDIETFMTKEYVTKYAKEALMELLDEVHEQALEYYRQELLRVRNEVQTLTSEHNVLKAQVDNLRTNKSDLVKETTILDTELERLKRELEDARVNGMTRVNDEIANEMTRLKNEVSSLNTQKENLTSSITELKDIINKYNRQIDNLGTNDGVQVIWEPIREDSPIYGLNTSNILLYITSLIEDYASKTGVNIKEAQNIIKVNCSGLYSIMNILDYGIDWSSGFKNPPIGFIIKKEQIYASVTKYADAIIESLSTIKLPRYVETKSNIDVRGINSESVPTDVNSVLREIHFQRMVLEARAKQKIAESQVEALTTLLQSVLPPEYDIKNFIPNIKEIGNGINEQDKMIEGPTLKL